MFPRRNVFLNEFFGFLEPFGFELVWHFHHRIILPAREYISNERTAVRSFDDKMKTSEVYASEVSF